MYQVIYRSRKTGRQVSGAGSEGLSDGQVLDGVGAPPSEEGLVAVARHSEDRTLDRYGYSGHWTPFQPREWDELDLAEAKATQEAFDAEVRGRFGKARVSGRIADTSDSRGDYMVWVRSGEVGEGKAIAVSEIRAAAEGNEDEPLLRRYYEILLAQALRYAPGRASQTHG